MKNVQGGRLHRRSLGNNQKQNLVWNKNDMKNRVGLSPFGDPGNKNLMDMYSFLAIKEENGFQDNRDYNVDNNFGDLQTFRNKYFGNKRFPT